MNSDEWAEILSKSIMEAMLRGDDRGALLLINDPSTTVEQLDMQVHVGTTYSKPQRPLHVAVRQGKKALVEALLAKGADINAQDTEKKTALYYAVLDKNHDIMKLLLRRKNIQCDIPDERGTTPFYHAVVSDDPVAAVALMEKGAKVSPDNGPSPLRGAASKGILPMITMLLDNSAHPDHGFALHAALLHGREEAATLLLDRGASFTLADDDRETPLHVAYHCPNAAKRLLKEGADINALDNKKRTPLLTLVLHQRHPELIASYIEHGADFYACIDDKPLLRHLIDHKAEPLFAQAMFKYGTDRFAPCATNDPQTMRDYYNRLDVIKPTPHIDWDHLSDNARRFLAAPATCGLPLIENGKATFLLQELCGAHKLQEAFAPEKWKGHGREAFRLCRRLHDALPDYWQQRYKSIAPDLPPLIHLAHDPVKPTDRARR